MNAQKLFNMVLVFVLMTMAVGTPVQGVSAQAGNLGIIHAYPENNFIDYQGADNNQYYTLTIDDPSNGAGVDYTDTVYQVAPPAQPELRYSAFQLIGFTLAAGHLVTISGGGHTRSLVVTPPGTITWNLDADIASGTMRPNSFVDVYVVPDGIRRYVTADADGNWSVVFSAPGDPHSETVDITPGRTGTLFEWDEDGDRTGYGWRIPTPVIKVWINENRMDGYEWTLGTSVTIEVDDPNTSQIVDYTETQTVVRPEWDPNGTIVWFNPGNLYQLKPGDLVTMTDGVITKTHTITQVTITGSGVGTDTVTGTAAPGSVVGICIHVGGCLWRWETADAEGNWLADFSVSQNEDPVYDIRPGTSMDAVQWEEDGDGTGYLYYVPNPTFSARLTANEVHSDGWPFDSQVTLTVEDLNTPQSPDYTRTETVTFADWDPNQTFVRFSPGVDNFTLQPGMLVTMAGSIGTKTHTITDLAVLGADAATDTVWGTGTPGTQVEVGHLCDNDGCAIRRTVIAADGAWRVDFSVPGGTEPDEQKTYNIQECYGNEARQHDEDGDSTQVAWNTYCPPQIFIEQYTFNLNNPLLANLTIRQAIAIGTDRQRILNQAFLPSEIYGQLVNSPIPPGDPYLAPASELTLYLYDPDEAMRLLTEFGWVDTTGDGIREKNGQELAFTFKTTINPMRTIAAQIFRENMQAIGIRITVIQEDPWAFFADDGTLVRGDFEIAEFAWSSVLEDTSLLDVYRATNAQNFGGYNNPAYEAALDAFQNATTEEARIMAAYQVQQIFTADLPAFYMFTRENIIPHQTPPGTSVTLTPLPQVAITYTNVNEEGVTAALAVSLNPADLPQSMQLVDSAYKIGTTAMFETVKVCLAYRDHWMSPAQEAALRLHHYRNGVWFDVTDPGSPDTVNNIVCGTATDFSIFAILMPTDSTPPVITPTLTGTQGLNGWYTSAVTIAWQVSDTESGIAAASGCEPVTLTTDTAGQTVTCAATNGAGLAHSESVTIKMDRTPPVITWLGSIASGSAFHFGFVPPAPTCTASDALSGLAGACTVSGYAATVGTHTLVASATDNAGNRAAESRTYSVLPWTLRGFYQPVDMNGVYNLVRGGSTVPFKFEIFAGATELTDPAQVRSLSHAETSCNAIAITDEIELTATGGTSLRYDTASGQFIYNWKTPRTPGKCYRVTVIMQDGSALLAYFKTR